MGVESKLPIELAIVNNVPGVIGVICRFVPSIVVLLRCVRHLVMIGELKAVCAGPAHSA